MWRLSLLLTFAILVSCSGPTTPSSAVIVTILPQPIVAVADSTPGPFSEIGVTWWHAEWTVDIRLPSAQSRLQRVKYMLMNPGGFVLFQQTVTAVQGDLDPRSYTPVVARYPKFGPSPVPIIPELTITVTILNNRGDAEDLVLHPRFEERLQN